MSTQMNNWHLSFQSYISSLGESILSFSLLLPLFPLTFLQSVFWCRLAGMLTLDCWLKKIALRMQLTLDTPSEPLQTAGWGSAFCFHLLFAQLLTGRITSAWGTWCQHTGLGSATGWGARGTCRSQWRSESLLFALNLPIQWREQCRSRIRQSFLVLFCKRWWIAPNVTQLSSLYPNITFFTKQTF